MATNFSVELEETALKYVVCPLCKGHGTHHGATCKKCGGTHIVDVDACSSLAMFLTEDLPLVDVAS